MSFVEHNHPNNRKYGLILLSVILTIAVGAIMAVSGCKSAEKRQAKLYGKFDKLKRKADADSVLKVVPPKWSLENFPVKLTGTKTVYLPGRTITKHDTILHTYTVKDTSYVTKTIVKHHHTVDTVVKSDTVLDSRPLAQLQHDFRQLNERLVLAQAKEQTAKNRLKSRTKAMWGSIGLNLLLLLLVAAYLLRRFGIIK